MIPRLIEEEANRVLALSIAVVMLVLVPLVGRAFPEKERAPFPICTEGAHRLADGRVACGRSGQEVLSAREALLMGTRIDANCAKKEDLEIVPGIGQKLAERIISDRSHRGPFRSVDDIDRVSGIGPKLVARMRPYVRVGETGCLR